MGEIMYINSVTSFLDAWRNLQLMHPQIIEDFAQSLEAINLAEFPKQERRNLRHQRFQSDKKEIETRYLVSPRFVYDVLRSKLANLGWQSNVRLSRITSRSNRFMTLDFAKDGVGLEIGLGKEAFIESRIFVGFPRFVQANIIDTAIVFMPTSSLSRKMSVSVGNFESISDMLQETRPLPLKYPFAIVGFSENETAIEVIELTTELDAFLIQSIDMTMEEMALLNEQPNYDFKVQLPKNDKLAQEICGFANSRNGGLILLGVDKNGKPVGLEKGKTLDEIRLQITNIIHANCRPVPNFEFFQFDNPENSTTAIIIIRIDKMERKPCMVQDKVYVRSGPSVRTADSEEIRRLVLE
jgi:hypothetical protein